MIWSLGVDLEAGGGRVESFAVCVCVYVLGNGRVCRVEVRFMRGILLGAVNAFRSYSLHRPITDGRHRKALGSDRFDAVFTPCKSPLNLNKD